MEFEDIKRGQVGATLSLLAGLAMFAIGLGLAQGDDVDCGGHRQGPDDICITTDLGTGEQTRATQNEQRDSNRVGGHLLAGLGGALTLGSGFVLYRKLRPGRSRPDTRVAEQAASVTAVRSALAAEHGWDFREVDNSLIPLVASWPFGGFDSGSTNWQVRDVVTGELDGHRFLIMDCHSYRQLLNMQSATTYWVVPVPGADQATLVPWFTSVGKPRMTRKPLITSYVGDGMICGVRGGKLGKDPAAKLLQGVRTVIAMVDAYRAHAERPAPRG